MKTKTTNPELTDEQTLTGAFTRFDSPLKTYDDGFGPLWIHRDSMGITAIVRAQTWNDAYEICEDEFFPACDLTAEDLVKEYGENWSDNALFQEAYGFRNNARKEADGSLSTIYAKDLNGDVLDRLTPELLAELEIYLEVETDETANA